MKTALFFVWACLLIPLFPQITAAAELSPPQPHGLPLTVTSQQSGGLLTGEATGLFAVPLAQVRDALVKPEYWCLVAPLHLNIKACTWKRQDRATILTLYAGRKHYRPPAQCHRIHFSFEVAQDSPDKVQIRLRAPRGPFASHDWELDAVATSVHDDTLVRVRFGCRFGRTATLIVGSYFRTLARNKVGFSRRGAHDERLVGGLRGLIERNVVRFFLAVEAYVATGNMPAPLRRQAMREHWFDATEQFPRQLHELDREEYLTIKQREQQAFSTLKE